MPRYVILEHDYPELHWDLMLEAGDVLRTWRLSAPPQLKQSVTTISSFDHRLLYLDYEGPISGDRGAVKRWDAGHFTWLSDEGNLVVVRLTGGRLTTTVRLEKKEESPNWTMATE